MKKKFAAFVLCVICLLSAAGCGQTKTDEQTPPAADQSTTTDDSTPCPEVFLKYADYFDVSLDYIFGRTDDPHGMIYNNCVKLGLNNPEMARFVEMCFDPGSAMNERLKATLVQMLSEVDAK